jgi:hypothetical protein
VRRTDLDELVEPREEVQLAFGLYEFESWIDCRVVVLSVIPPHVETNGDTLDQVSELGEDVLRQQIALVRQ